MFKKIIFLLFTFLSINWCSAQFYKSIIPSPEFNSALEKIVLDFRFNFETIKGNNINDNPDIKIFESAIKIPGAEECIIYYFNSTIDTTASWQAVMYRGEDFKEASRSYENVFRLVKKSKVRWIDKSTVGFTGSMEQPGEDIRFAVSTLDFELEDERYEEFKAEIELVSTYKGWEVHLNLLTKKPDDGKLSGL